VILDRVVPIWDPAIADLLRSKLSAGGIQPQAFRKILASLLKFDDAEAVRIARDRLSSAVGAVNKDQEKAVFASLELLASNPRGEWPAAWDAIQRNQEFAQRFFATMAVEPYGETTVRIAQGLPETFLADMQIWLLQKASRDGDEQSEFIVQRTGPWTGSPVAPQVGWSALRNVVTNNLLFRATPASTEALRKVREVFPNEMWGRLERDSEELVRDASWTPLSPAEFLDLALIPQPSAVATRGADGEEKKHDEKAKLESGARREAEPKPAVAEPVTFQRRFKRAGDTWELMFEGAYFTVKDSKGMAYIRLLLQSPDRTLDSLELIAVSGVTTAKQISKEDKAYLALSRDIGEEVLDKRAQSEYKAEIMNFEREIANAERNNDFGKVEILRTQKAEVAEQLLRHTGLGGRSRTFSAASEKARKAVSNAITTALNRINQYSPKMKEHLKTRIVRGKLLSFRGDGVDWEL
jgi:hypothetical protein